MTVPGSLLPPAAVAAGATVGLLLLGLLHHVRGRAPLVAAHGHWVDDHRGVVIGAPDLGPGDGHLSIGVLRGDVDF